MIQIERIDASEWNVLAEDAHLVVFQENRPAFMNRIDYVLIASSNLEMIGYITVRELDSASVYWQFGGVLPKYRSTATVLKAYQKAIEETKVAYENIFTYIRNDNIRMLKLAMSQGFKIIGTKTFDGVIYVEHLLELQGG
jgi:hypothetical protein